LAFVVVLVAVFFGRPGFFFAAGMCSPPMDICARCADVHCLVWLGEAQELNGVQCG
jgi:hypothetical protein